MAVDVTSLRKVLELEQKKGYLDKAVIGGLDKFLQRWVTQATASANSSQALGRLRKLNLEKTGYAALTPEQRQAWLSRVLDSLGKLESSAEKGGAKPPPAKRPPATSKTAKAPPGQSVDAPITVIKGINTTMATKFKKLGVQTVRDLLYFFPNRHLDYSQTRTIAQLTQGEDETIIANVWEAREVRLGGRPGTEATVGDDTGNIRVVWFNQPYLAKRLATNSRIVISGRVREFGGRLEFVAPEWEPLEDRELIHTARLVPLYPLTQGLHPRQVRKLMKGVIDQWARQLADFLPLELKERCNLLGLPEAISQAHFPEDELLKARARVRLAFDELFLLQLGVLRQKRHWQESQPGNPLPIPTTILDTFIRSLPFKLTEAQHKVLDEIMADLQKSQPMSRLLQGEVGSGKTVVATVALLVAAANGFQGAFMAPTEVLAEQHFTTMRQLLTRTGEETRLEDYLYSYAGLLPQPLTVALLMGDLTAAHKKKLHQRVLKGEVDVVIGTHALIQKDVAFPRLGLVVVDEQHRFGVEQRLALRQKGFNPHVLVMTATPIPRTLALTLYGDLDLSVINQLPPGRQAIKTKWLKPEQRNTAYAFIARQVAGGRQAFIICPLVEESESVQARAAVAEYERLVREVFPQLRLGLLHGRLSAAEKDAVMRRFRAGELHILVATPVIEVGIDVPNATVMLVDSADRFGLSQLHQFRGRVGRGQEQSYCMLLAENPSEIGRQRLELIEKTHDGFALAEEDLKLRGPGEFFGTRQSGLPDLRMARLSDLAILELARSEAIKLFERDKNLSRPEHRLLAKELSRMWPKSGEWS